MTEAELKKKEQELNKKEAELNKKEASLSFRELNASNSYQQQFKEKFKEIVEPLQLRERELSQQEAKLANERAVLLSELEKKFAKREADLSAKEEEIISKKIAVETEISERKAQMLKDTELECNAIRKKNIKDLSEEMENVRKENNNREVALEERIARLTKEKAQAILEEQEIKGENEKYKSYITEKTTEIAELKEEIVRLKNDNEPLQSEVEALKVANKQLSELIKKKESQLKAFETLKSSLGEKSIDYYIHSITELEKNEEELKNQKQQLQEERNSFAFEKKLNEAKEKFLTDRENRLDEEILHACEPRIQSVVSQLESANEEIARLRQEIKNRDSIIHTYGDYSEVSEKAELLKKINELKVILTHKNEELAKHPTEFMDMEINRLEESKRHFELEKKEFEKKEQDYKNLQSENGELKQKIHEAEIAQKTAERERLYIQDAYNRLTVTNEKDSSREERIKAIETPFIKEENCLPKMQKEPKTEREWLDNICKGIDDFGLHFPRRIVDAFHTSLKIAEMSPLTVLAGVSGTGKSELPRLYSHFGGINFLGIPVQPNWDCQESMLGYFNSIDNYFDAQDVLKLLAQSQRAPDKNSGLNDSLTLILLDEMNLANVELYFSDFLSKLETRRGCDDDHVPTLGVKIGAKMEDYQLKLTRNVLWTGTMNQDETTKTLSDKVLDRGIVINFPRPKKFISRSGKNKSLDKPSELLPRNTWQKWLSKANEKKLPNEVIEKYKKKVEDINELLGSTGRALGHRVWQSIELYIANYPDVVYEDDPKLKEKAMDRAFEDQIVQKIMPKLRGIETRGEQGKVLDKIRGLIPETLHGDFDNAKSQGYGQFMWCSSDYILRGDETDPTDSKPAVSNEENKKKIHR